jgi:hypothetical protein
MDSVNGNNDYARVDVHWSDVPGRDEEWKELMIRSTSADQFRQEFDCLTGDTKVNILFKNNTTKKVTIEQIYK